MKWVSGEGGVTGEVDGDPKVRGDALSVRVRKPELVFYLEYIKALRVSVNPETTQTFVHVCVFLEKRPEIS